MADELKAAKSKLAKVLGPSFINYTNLLKKWFCQKIDKDEFDLQARLLFTMETIHHHNDFFAALLTKCQFKFSSKRKTGGGNIGGGGGLSGFKALKRMKKSAIANFNSEKSFQPPVSLNQTGIVDAEPAACSAYANGTIQRFCTKEGVLPDPPMIHGRLLVVCWENDVDDMDDQVLPLIIYALRNALKNLIHACVELRRSHLLYDERFQHCFNADDVSITSNAADTDSNYRIASDTVELKDDGFASTLAYTPRTKISSSDLLQALKIRPNLIPIHSLYQCLFDRLTLYSKAYN